MSVELTVKYTRYVGSDWAEFWAAAFPHRIGDAAYNAPYVVYTGHPEDFWQEAAYWINKLGGISYVVEEVTEDVDSLPS